MNINDKIYIAGHRGLVGSTLVRHLQKQGFNNLLLRSREELDLTNQQAVNAFFAKEKPLWVFLAAAKVGGIGANSTYPAEFIRDNLVIQSNIIDAAYRHGCQKLLFLGSSCIYPKFAPQPIQESSLLTGSLEPTNEWYAIAKIAGIKMCQAYYQQYGFKTISVMPTNLYGPGDNFNLENAHVMPALIHRMHLAKIEQKSDVIIWGSGKPQREFLHVDDLADALLFLMKNYEEPEIINIGTGQEVSIAELATTIREIIDYQGVLTWDQTKPDGTPRKRLDVNKLTNYGWQARIALKDGIRDTYQWFLSNSLQIRK